MQQHTQAAQSGDISDPRNSNARAANPGDATDRNDKVQTTTVAATVKVESTPAVAQDPRVRLTHGILRQDGKHTYCRTWPPAPGTKTPARTDTTTLAAALTLMVAPPKPGGIRDGQVYLLPYWSPTEHRLSADAIGQTDIWMTLVLVDIDGPGHGYSEEWGNAVAPALIAILRTFPGVFLARSRGGWRLYARLRFPFPIRTQLDAATWTARFKTLLDDLDAIAMSACGGWHGGNLDRISPEWNRLQRIPHDCRDGVTQDIGTHGEPANVGYIDLPEARYPVNVVESGGQISDDAEKLLSLCKYGYAYLCAVKQRTPGLAIYGVSEKLDNAVEVRSPFADDYSHPEKPDDYVILCAPIDGNVGENFGGFVSYHGGQDKSRPLREHFAKLEAMCPTLKDSWGNPQPTPQPRFDSARGHAPANDTTPRPPDGGGTPAHANDGGTSTAAQARTGTAYDGRDPAVDELIARLAVPTIGMYQRSGALCTVTRDAHACDGVVRPTGAPTIREMRHARLKEIIRTIDPKQVALANDVAARGEWSYVRPLDAVVTYPTMRRDGTLLLTNGYDAQTRTLAELDVQVQIPDAPTQADAQTALETLTALVKDFPFVGESRSAWLAALLTVPARPAIDGPTPLGLFEASERGSGKSLLADVISVIATGRTAPRRVAPKTKEEWDKTMLSILLAGDPIVLIDNITTMLVSDALDAVLTGTTYTQRLLGVSEDRRVAIRTVFLASSNNARLSTDLIRRSIACRLEPKEENPEQRTGFTHADLLGHCRKHRADLLGAALTILRAYAVADRPEVNARQMGSYDSWCRVVRDALVWAGGTDPASTQDALRETADVERDELRDLLTAWHALLKDKPVTVRQLLDARHDTGAGTHETRLALADALCGITPNAAEPTAHSVGNKLRMFHKRIVGGLTLEQGAPDRDKVRTWSVVKLG